MHEITTNIYILKQYSCISGNVSTIEAQHGFPVHGAEVTGRVQELSSSVIRPGLFAPAPNLLTFQSDMSFHNHTSLALCSIYKKTFY